MINEYEKDTDDVYKALMAVDSTKKLCTFIDELKTTYSDMSFAEYFNRYMADFEGSRQTLARSSQIGKDYIYPILKGTKKPERDKIIALCLADRCQGCCPPFCSEVGRVQRCPDSYDRHAVSSR